jgi:ABC-type transport system involved in multi-copper enzyme maturation permease subunit
MTVTFSALVLAAWAAAATAAAFFIFTRRDVTA